MASFRTLITSSQRAVKHNSLSRWTRKPPLPEGTSTSYRCMYQKGSYEGDGKTNVTVLNQDFQTGLMIDSLSQVGFGLNNGLSVLGPIAIFPNSVISWNIGNVTDINDESLTLFRMMEPKIDILVLGVGDSKEGTVKELNNIINLVRHYKIQVEVLPTEQACTTFNFLTYERRFVGAGLIPPRHIQDAFGTAMTLKTAQVALSSKED